MEEMRKARYGGRAQSLHVLSKCASLPKSSCVHQPRSSLIPVLLSFYGVYVTWARLIKSLAVGY